VQLKCFLADEGNFLQQIKTRNISYKENSVWLRFKLKYELHL